MLVLIRLKGGNDGLNTIIPVYDYDTYVSKRPSIHIPKNNLIRLNDDFSMPDHMSNLSGFWENGKMRIVNGVGYEGQNLSHFTSSDYWATGSTNKSDMVSSGGLAGIMMKNTLTIQQIHLKNLLPFKLEVMLI